MLSEKQVKARRRGVGASDMAAILGRSRFANMADIYAAKVEGTQKKQSDRMLAGHFMEPAILAWAATQLGPIRKGRVRVKPRTPLRAHPDGIVIASGEPVEAKVSSWSAGWTRFDVPEEYRIQVTVQMICCRKRRAWIAALLDGVLRLYCIELDEALRAEILVAADEFQRRVKDRAGCGDMVPSLETLQNRERLGDVVRELPLDLVRQWQAADHDAKEAKALAEKLKRLVIDQLGDCERGRCQDGDITYKAGQRKSVDTALLARKYPDVFSKVEKVTEHRYLRYRRRTDDAFV